MSAANLGRTVEARAESWIALRRAFHRHPEVGWLEVWTTDRIVAELTPLEIEIVWGAQLHEPGLRMGLPSEVAMERATLQAIETGADPARAAAVRGGFTGAMAIIRGALPGTVRALRCDIDALPIPESEDPAHLPFKGGFASRWPGTMHACGHDAHTAIALGVAETLARHRQELRGTVKIVFQPAEEGVRGAASMVATGITDDVSELYGFHVGVGATETGEIVGGWDDLLATCKLDVHCHGRRAHAALARREGRDALGAACWTVGEFARRSAEIPGLLVNVGRLRGGEARNVIAAEATMEIDLRASDDHDIDKARRLIEEVLADAAAQYGVTSSILLVGEAPSARSDDRAIENVVRSAAGMRGLKVRRRGASYGASDDAALWMQYVLGRGGIASFIGIGSPTGSGHHTPAFDVDELAIPIGVELLARLLMGDEDQKR